MSLNIFKAKPEKTDASLNYKAVIDNLHVMDTTAASLNIDQFIQSENILLGKHQEFYGDKRDDSEFSPRKLDKDTQLAADGTTRALVNSFIQLSNAMPEIKSEAAECNQQVEASISQNQKTKAQIEKATADLNL
ncbi:uncharacterized protein ATC70_001348 [Mucor velutinosus]|uniref:Uncharacterized protein n=1 Tax=Mucor velutinosus TaxID=708070 RepID=A0AAN7HNW6_9FUNG|nr:hypothetical protein ATC70_001348 [Mucor velutinosus]